MRDFERWRADKSKFKYEGVNSLTESLWIKKLTFFFLRDRMTEKRV